MASSLSSASFNCTLVNRPKKIVSPYDYKTNEYSRQALSLDQAILTYKRRLPLKITNDRVPGTPIFLCIISHGSFFEITAQIITLS